MPRSFTARCRRTSSTESASVSHVSHFLEFPVHTFTALSSAPTRRPSSSGDAMPPGRLWLVVLAIRVHGVHSAPNPTSALKGERPTERRLAHTCSCKAPLGPAPAPPRLRHSERAGRGPSPESSDCSMRLDCPSAMTERDASREPSRRAATPKDGVSPLSSPTGSPCHAVCARACVSRARSSVWRRCSAASAAATTAASAATAASATSAAAFTAAAAAFAAATAAAAVAATAPAAGAPGAHVGGASRRDHFRHGERPLARR